MIRLKILTFVLVVSLSAAVYGITLCPTVEFIDSGELAMAANNLGIAHPTGYPLYTLLGRLASIALPGSLIIRQNLLSLLFTSFAAGFAYLLFTRIIGAIMSGYWRELAAASVALFLALSPVWWSQGTTNEVYSLNLLLISIAVWSLFKWTDRSQDGNRWLYLSAYVIGLCLTNHLSAIYLIPGFLIILIPEIRNSAGALKKTLIAGLFFILPASLYLFLPIRASFKPFLNWGGVNDPYFFYKHITGWQYRVWMFEKPLEIFKDLGAKMGPSLSLLWDQFGLLGTILILIGLVFAGSRYKRVFIFGIVVFVINLIYVLNYDIIDIEAYYLPTILIAGIFMVMGLARLSGLPKESDKLRKFSGIAMAAILIALPVYGMMGNYAVSDRSRKTFAAQGARDLTASMEPAGVALMQNWDFYSPWLYLYFAENHEPGKVLLDKELMRRSWYIDFIRRYHPEIYERSKPEFEEFLRRIEDFERDRPFDPRPLDLAFYNMLRAIIIHESAYRPVYTNIMDDPKLLQGTVPIPDGILFRFGTLDGFLERPRYNFDERYWIENPTPKDKRVANLLSFYHRAFESRQKYCAHFARHDEEAYYKELAAKVKSIMADAE